MFRKQRTSVMFTLMNIDMNKSTRCHVYLHCFLVFWLYPTLLRQVNSSLYVNTLQQQGSNPGPLSHWVRQGITSWRLSFMPVCDPHCVAWVIVRQDRDLLNGVAHFCRSVCNYIDTQCKLHLGGNERSWNHFREGYANYCEWNCASWVIELETSRNRSRVIRIYRDHYLDR